MRPDIIRIALATLGISLAGAAYPQEKPEDKPPPQAPESTPQAEKPRKEEPGSPESQRDRRAEERRKPARPQGDGMPFIGVVTRNLLPELGEHLGLDARTGVLVEEVMPDSPAERAGVRKFDVIVRLDGERISESAQLADRIREKRRGDQVTLQIIRRGNPQDLKVSVDEHPMPPGFDRFRNFRERGPFGSWGHRFDRWLEEEAQRDRQGRRDRQPEITADAIEDALRQMEKFTREFKEQQQKLEQQFREYQERFQQQLREFKERLREDPDRDPKDPSRPSRRDDIMRSRPQPDSQPVSRDKA